jgi:hypothetical protein
MKTARFRIEGVRPLFLHNGDLANPLNQYARSLKGLTSKRKKTDADLMEIAKMEWFGGLYPQGGKPEIVIPGKMIRKCLIQGARKDKLGKQMEVAVIPPADVPLIYEGPKDPEKLWDSGEFTSIEPVGVNQSKTIRCRPKFQKWSVEIELEYLEDLVNEAQVQQAFAKAGREVGLGDWRPLYGLFQVTNL